jgi:hypothetical protein
MFFLPGWWRLAGFLIWLALDLRVSMLARLQRTRPAWTRAVSLTVATFAIGLQLFWSDRSVAVSVVIWGVLACCCAALYFSRRKN